MVVGSQAVLQYGIPRFTQDIDLIVGLIPHEVERIIEATKAEFRPLPIDVKRFVEETWVLPIEHTRARVRVDLIFSAKSFERKAFENAFTLVVKGVSIRYISPGDLIVQKIIAGRPRDLEDARGVLRVQANRIDEKRVEKELLVLAAQTDHSEWVERWRALREFGG